MIISRRAIVNHEETIVAIGKSEQPIPNQNTVLTCEG